MKNIELQHKYEADLQKLIQCETISEYYQQDKSKFYKFHELLKETFPLLFNKCIFEDFDGSFLLKWESETDLEPVLFMNHHDVVAINGQWAHDPFSGEIVDGKLWGRGTLDTKGGLWAMLQAAEELIEEGFIPTRDIYFESACTEEVDGTGADKISLELEKREIHLYSVFDEGGMITEEPVAGAKGLYAIVGVGEKNCVDMKFIAKSHGGHASTPTKNTPLVRLGKFMVEVENSNIFNVQINEPTKALLKSAANKMDGKFKRLLLSHPNFFGPILKKVLPNISPTMAAMLKTTIAFTKAQGSDGLNVIPSEAYVTGNMRVAHHQGKEKAINAIEKIAKKYDITIEMIDEGFESGLSDFNNKPFKLIEKAIKETIGKDIDTLPYVMNGASDSKYFSRVCDNCYRFLPFIVDEQQLASIHGIDENIDVSNLLPAVNYYKYLIREC